MLRPPLAPHPGGSPGLEVAHPDLQVANQVSQLGYAVLRRLRFGSPIDEDCLWDLLLLLRRLRTRLLRPEISSELAHSLAGSSDEDSGELLRWFEARHGVLEILEHQLEESLRGGQEATEREILADLLEHQRELLSRLFRGRELLAARPASELTLRSQARNQELAREESERLRKDIQRFQARWPVIGLRATLSRDEAEAPLTERLQELETA